MFSRFKTLLLRSAAVVVMAALFPALLPGQNLPVGNRDAPERLQQSPRRSEVVEITTPSGDRIKARVVYPQGGAPAPVVVALHGIPGWTPWIQMLADQLAAEGFIAIAPDMVSGKGAEGKGSEGMAVDDAAKLVFALTWEEVVERINAVAEYAMALPAAEKRFAVVGFCWGGRTAFAYAGERPELGAAVVYYGESPAADTPCDLIIQGNSLYN